MTAPLSDERLAEIPQRVEQVKFLGIPGITRVQLEGAEDLDALRRLIGEDVPALLAVVERLRAEMDDLRGQNAMTEQHFANYVAEAIVTQDQLRRRAETAEADRDQLVVDLGDIREEVQRALALIDQYDDGGETWSAVRDALNGVESLSPSS